MQPEKNMKRVQNKRYYCVKESESLLNYEQYWNRHTNHIRNALLFVYSDVLAQYLTLGLPES